MEGVEPEMLNLFCSGAPLEDEVSLAFLENQAIDLTIPLKGGKVHGSLARAGKVRGQTPKVEAQEKKKKKAGRAKRRIQYNRRFVNVVETFGRKKGPNSNSQILEFIFLSGFLIEQHLGLKKIPHQLSSAT